MAWRMTLGLIEQIAHGICSIGSITKVLSE
jgi:hypothetical protein